MTSFKKKVIFLLDNFTKIFGKSIFEFNKLKVKRNIPETSSLDFALVIGPPRSGTTLLESILSTHKDIICPLEEVDFASNDLNQEMNLLFGEPLRGETLGSYLEEQSKGKYLVLKRPTAIFYLDVLIKKFPNMKVIYIERNPGDTILSQMKSHHFEWPFNFALRQWKRMIKLNLKYKQGIKNYIGLRYRSLITNPVEEINGVLRFLNQKEMTPNQINNFHKNISMKSKLPVKNAGSRIKRDNMNKWKTKLKESQKKRIKKLLKELSKKEYGFK